MFLGERNKHNTITFIKHMRKQDKKIFRLRKYVLKDCIITFLQIT